MYPVNKLTWDDELRLSDDLHEAREVKKRLDGAEPETHHDIEALRKGKEAADELIVAHHGLAKRIANQVLFGADSASTIDFDDLVQVGMMAMYTVANSFDARRRSDGLDKDTGNRFSVHATMYVRRDMYRAVQREEAILTGSIAASERTRVWLQRKDELQDQIGRRPTPAEVSEFSGIPLSAVDITLVGKNPVIGQSVTPDGDDDEMTLDVSDESLSNVIQKSLDADVYNAALDGVIRELLPLDEADALSLWLGLDRETPRIFSEVASAMGLRVSEAREKVEYGMSRLRHPQNAARVGQVAAAAVSSVESEDPRSAA